MICFTVRGVQVRVRFLFLALLSLVCLAVPAPAHLLAACVCHELGHLLCMAACGVSLAAVECTGGGLLLVPARDRMLSGGREVAVLLSGPAVNLLLAAAFLRADCGAAARTQLLVGLWNLLPVPQLDGGAAVRCLFARTNGGRGADVLLGRLGGIVTLCLGAAVLYHAPRHFLLGAVLCWVGGCTLANPAGM